ncbi:MAG: hypothetical protein GX418_00840 [Clostridiales bacterium]|nr:hypothetical protein [Clostridiales bacterium]
MNVTWMIGNGFDLGVGLKTSYQDFLTGYLKKTARSPQVNRDKGLIRKEWKNPECNWSDMELRLGHFTTQFPGDQGGLNRFNALLEDLVNELKASFILEEMKAQINQNNNTICDQFIQALQSPHASLPPTDRAAVDCIWRRHQCESVIHHFINFNYTNVLDNCLQCMRKRFSAIRRHVGRRVLYDRVGELIHVHSDLRQSPILGVDHFAQIMNPDFRDQALARAFVKPLAIIAAGLDTADRTRQLIADSQLVITLGMSIGVTDSTWWLELARWLSRGQDRHLIILETNPSVNHPYNGRMQKRKADIWCLLETVMGRDVFWAVQQRIHIASNLIPGTQNRLLGFRLVPEPPPPPSLGLLLKRLQTAIAWLQPSQKRPPAAPPAMDQRAPAPDPSADQSSQPGQEPVSAG